MSPRARSQAGGSLTDDLERLEDIVRRLEADDTDLDAGLALFEEGVKALRAARERLAQAELRVQAVLDSAGDELVLGDLDV